MLEHYHLAQRYKKKFPAFFPPYYPTKYHIRSTHILRTSQSAASFLFGIFEGMGPLNQFSSPTNLSTDGFQPVGLGIESADEDKLLRFMDNCPAYTNCPMTKNAGLEATKLQKSEKYKKLVLDPISERAGFSLTVEDVEGLYNLCNFEHVSPTESNNSSFCDLIPRSAFALLDYSRDFYEYYRSSYPNKLGYELSCVVLKDVLREFESEESATALRFAHSETIVPLITLLGINEDQDIIYTWDKEEFWNRTTKLSELDPFATNMGFVVFRNSSSEQDIIKIYLNEREVKITACASSEEGCTRDELLDIVRGTLGQCDRSAMCFGTNATNDDVIISLVDDVIVSKRDNENDNVQPMNESTSLTSQCISEKNVGLAVAVKLADENKILLDFNLFVIMTGLSGLCIVLMGLVAFNRKTIISNGVNSGYHKLPFLDS
ncbi:multiple inositol polyphosphate phosphatase 1-like [Bolinopsis microptera]|uniref:multiple inositol polyphosphate phosphatase 1-like n=1 Tax=Bolinopsis microptera TaxID=2820187 RepID=UPI00307A7240